MWRIPACYDASLAPDLAEVASRTGLTPQQVAERHSAVTYHVYMVGFLPGYPYMGDLPPELALPRRENPRTKVPPGSIAIATTHDGGLHAGKSGRLASDRANAGSPVGPAPRPARRARRPATRSCFGPSSLGEYEALLAQAAAGTFRLEPEERPDRGAAHEARC